MSIPFIYFPNHSFDLPGKCTVCHWGLVHDITVLQFRMALLTPQSLSSFPPIDSSCRNSHTCNSVCPVLNHNLNQKRSEKQIVCFSLLPQRSQRQRVQEVTFTQQFVHTWGNLLNLQGSFHSVIGHLADKMTNILNTTSCTYNFILPKDIFYFFCRDTHKHFFKQCHSVEWCLNKFWTLIYLVGVL